MKNSRDLTNDILERVSLVDVAKIIAPSRLISKQGKTRCPLHADNHPSFIYSKYAKIDRWKCFAGCGSGNVLDFIIASGQASGIHESVTWLINNDLLNLSDIKDEDQQNQFIDNLVAQRKHQDLLNKFSKFVREGLLTSSDQAQAARDYLNTRSIANVETLTSRFNIGFFESRRLEECGFTKQELRSLGLLGKSGKVVMDNCLCFMYQKTFGEFSGFKLRPLDGKQPKFFGALKSRSRKKTLVDDIGFFGLCSMDPSSIKTYVDSDVVLVEGEFDLLVPQYKCLELLGDTFTILCRSGGAIDSPVAFESLREHGFKSIAVFPDSDSAGINFVKTISKIATGFGLRVDVVWPSEFDVNPNTDPADICKGLNAEEIHDLIYNSRSPISTFLASRAVLAYEDLKTKIDNPTTLRVEARKVFAKLAEEYSISDSMKDEYCYELEAKIGDSRLTAENIRSDLNELGISGEVFRIRGDVYMVTNKGYERWISTDSSKEGFSSRVTNFIVKYTKMIQFPGDEEWEIEGKIVVDGRESKSSFLVPSSELVSPDHFNNLIRKRHPVGIKGLKDIKEVLPDLVSESNRDVPQFSGVDRIGYAPGSRCFITPSTIIEDGEFTENTSYQVARSDTTIRQYFENIDFDIDELKKADLKKSAELLIDYYLECLPKSVTLITLGHVYSSVMTPYFSKHMPPNALFLRGLAGSFKSTFARLSLCLFYKGPMNEQKCLHAGHTVNSIQTCLSYVDNAPLVLDDIKAERKGVEDVMLVIQSLYDEQGRSRLNRDFTVREGRATRNQGLIITGESVPTDQLSILTRMLQIEFVKDTVDTSKFTYLETNSGELRMLTPYFIRWLQNNYKEDSIPIHSMRIQDFPNYHLERAYHQVSKVLTSLKVFFRFLHEEVKINNGVLEELFAQAEKEADKLFRANVAEAKNSMKESAFLKDVSNYLLNGFFTLTRGDEGILIGRIEGDSVLLDPWKLRMAFKTKTELRHTASLIPQILKDLVYQGHCTKTSSGEFKFKKDLLVVSRESDLDNANSITYEEGIAPEYS